MHVLVSCKLEEVPIRMKALERSQNFSNCRSMRIFSNAQWQLTPQSMVESCRISNSTETLLMSSLPVKMKKIRSKMKVFTLIYIYLSDAQGLITPESVVESDRNSNSSTLSYMSSLPAIMTKIQSNMKGLE